MRSADSAVKLAMRGVSATLASAFSGDVVAGGSPSRTSSPAPAIVPLVIAAGRASPSTISPRAVLTSTALRLMAANARSPINGRSARGTMIDTASAQPRPSSRSATGSTLPPGQPVSAKNEAQARTCIPNAPARRARCRPMRPKPMIGKFLPETSRACSRLRQDQSPERTERSACRVCFMAVRISIMQWSAKETYFESPTTVSTMPRSTSDGR